MVFAVPLHPFPLGDLGPESHRPKPVIKELGVNDRLTLAQLLFYLLSTRRLGSFALRSYSRRASLTKAKSSEHGSGSSSAAMSSAVSLETSISWTRRLRVATCSARPATPPSGMYVCLSQCRAFLAVFTSLIVASRSLSHRSASFGLSVDMATMISECCEAC